MEKTFKILSVVLLLLITGCRTIKHSKTHSLETQVDSVYVQKDSVHSITINSAIQDKIFIKVATGDTLLDSLVNQKLQHFTSSKQSGTNSYSVRYDTQAQGFEIRSTIGATKEVVTKQRDSISTSQHKKKKQEVKEQTTTHRLPLWVWVLLLVLAGMVYGIVKTT
ncbi:hypothetical protein [Tenacibaculum discolor]|uniref:hypothetical protein n=1 Tax=Tenacibaculum discolor TaxID=361581 RepID=UPI000EB3ECD8|nr:hypothetical protein [Tenacibaculum discolor]RLK06744.1 hypothetical protein C8N27_0305 [Tenacibaculum discolor]